MENHDDVQRDTMTPRAAAANAKIRDYAPSDQQPHGAEPPRTLLQWLASNGLMLAIVLGAVGFLMWKFDPEGVIKVAIGLSLVIFLHELGHFMVAKWCDVHVTTFSVGFGPAIPGCWFQWGETLYKLAIFPLGGYVQMVGQVDGDEASDGSEDDPRSYRNKTVGQRMAIISAGVIMNAILACVCFIVVYQGRGKDNPAAVVNEVDASSPAGEQGVRTGSKILEIGSVTNPNFNHLRTVVVYSQDGEKMKFVAQRPEDELPLRLEIEPRISKDGLRPVIGVGPASRLELADARLMGPRNPGPFWPDSPAALATAKSGATPALQFGDQIIATTDPDDPTRLKELPRDERNDQKEQKDYFEFQRRMIRLASQDVTLLVLRTNGTKDEVLVKPAHHLTLGIRMQMGQVTALRKGSPADTAAVRIPRKEKDGSFKGDIILGVVARDAQGKVLAEFGDDKKDKLDPERLPYQLQRCADAVRAANGKAEMKVTLKIERHRTGGGVDAEQKDLLLDWDDSWRFDQVVPFNNGSSLAIPELGLAYQIKPVVAEVLIAGNPIMKDDQIKELKVTFLLAGRNEERTLDPEDNWAYVLRWLNQHSTRVANVTVKVLRNKDLVTVKMAPVADSSWPLADRGWFFMPDERRKQADNIVEAVGFGLSDTGNFMMQVWQTLRGMFTGRLSVKNLGGPITIADTAYRIAGYDTWEFIFFLGLISINLAVINFLPIPVLDGGHMVFLIYEKLRGRQASEAVRIGATYVGLALIASLMLFVLYLDYRRISQ